MDTSIDAVIDELGFGSFNRKLCFIIGMFWMLDGIEVTFISLVVSQLKCEWNLSLFQTALASSAVFFGLGIGAMYWGWLGDKYGRRIPMFVSCLFMLYFGLLTSTANNFVWFLLLRIFVCIGTGGVSTGICYISEYSPTTHRGRIIIGTQIFFALGNVYGAVIAYFTMTTLGWRIFVLFCAIPLLFIIPLFQWLPESIRYLQNTGNMDAIMKILHFMSNENKIPLPKHLNIECELSKERGNVSILLKRQYVMKFLTMVILWIVGLGTYYCVVLMNTLILKNKIYDSHFTMSRTHTCHTLTHQEYLQNIIVVVGELPGIILALLVVEKFGHKKCLALNYFVISASTLCLALPLTPTLSTIVLFILRAMVVTTCPLLFLYTTELFPTIVRNTALGLSGGIARWFATMVPFFVTMLISSSYFIFIIVLSSLTLLCSLLCCLLPETTGLYLTNK